MKRNAETPDRVRPRRVRSTDSGVGGDVVIGRNSVREVFNAKSRKVSSVWISEDTEEAAVLDEIRDLARNAGVTIRAVTKQQLRDRAHSESHQGVLAEVEPFVNRKVADLCLGIAPLIVVVDGITDPQNLGAILRSAEVAGATGVILTERRGANLTPVAMKTSAGAAEYLDYAQVSNLSNALDDLRKANVWIVGLAGEATETIYDCKLFDQPVAIVMGAEGSGLSQLTRKRCDVLVSIPQQGKTESLNVSAAAAVVLFHAAHSRN